MSVPTLPTQPDDAPRDGVEELIAQLWRQALGVERVGVDDHFYALGGDSLLATVVACGISGSTGVEIPPRLTMEHLELGRLAEAVRRTLRAAAGGAEVRDGGRAAPGARTRPDGPGEYPQADPRGNVMAVLQMEPLAFHARAAERAVSALLARHGIEPSESASGHSPSSSIARVLDLRDHPGVRRRRGHLFHHAAAAEAALPFPRSGRAVRATVVLLPEETWTFLLVSHRAVCDAVSLGILCHELRALYAGAGHDELPELPATYAALLRPYLQAAGRAARWSTPGGLGSPGPLAPSGAASSFLLETGLSDALRRLAREEETTLFTVIGAAYAALMARWLALPAVEIGCYALNRTRSALHGLVGPLAALTTLRTDLSDDPPFRELLRRLRAETLARVDGPAPGPRAPLPRGAEDTSPFLPILEFRGPDHPLGSLDRLVDTGLAAHALLLFVAEGGPRLCFTLEYDSSRFSHAGMTRLGGLLKRLLRSLGEHPDAPVSRLFREDAGTTPALRVWREDIQSYSLLFLPRPPGAGDRESMERAREPVDGGPVTVLTAVHARSSRRLRRFLRALRAQRYAGRLEIVVCDDASPSPEGLRQACSEFGARYVRVTRGSEHPEAMHKCRALNAGLEAARGRYLLYLDGDMLLTPFHVQNCVNLLRHHGEQTVCSNRRSDLVNLLAGSDPGPSSRFHLTLERALNLLDRLETWEPVPCPDLGGEWTHVLGNNLFLTRSLAEQVGPWDEEYVGYGEEDVDYALRIHRCGGRFARVAGLPVFHVGHPRQEGDERQAALWARNALRFYSKFPEAAPLRPQWYQMFREHFGNHLPTPPPAPAGARRGASEAVIPRGGA